MSTSPSPSMSASSTLFVHSLVAPIVDLVASSQRLSGSIDADLCAGPWQACSDCCSPPPQALSAKTTSVTNSPGLRACRTIDGAVHHLLLRCLPYATTVAYSHEVGQRLTQTAYS